MNDRKDCYSIPTMERVFSDELEYQSFIEICCEQCTKHKVDSYGCPADNSCKIEERIDLAWFDCEDFPRVDLLDGGYCQVLCKHFHTDDDYLMREYYRAVGVEIPEQLTFDMLMEART